MYYLREEFLVLLLARLRVVRLCGGRGRGRGGGRRGGGRGDAHAQVADQRGRSAAQLLQALLDLQQRVQGLHHIINTNIVPALANILLLNLSMTQSLPGSQKVLRTPARQRRDRGVVVVSKSLTYISHPWRWIIRII